MVPFFNLKKMQKLIYIETVTHTPNGELYSDVNSYTNWHDAGKREQCKYRWRISKVNPTAIFKDSLEDLYDELGDIMNDTEVGDVVVKKGTKFHFFPGTTFPRQQFKELQQAHGVKSVRDSSKADYIVLNNGLLTNIEKCSWTYGKINSSTMFNLLYFFDESFMPGYKDITEPHNLNKITIENYINKDAIFILGYNITSALTAALTELKENPPVTFTENDKSLLELTIVNLNAGSNYVTSITEEDYDLLEKYNDSDYYGKLVTTDLLSKVIDKHLDKVELDQEQYESLHKMFESEDCDNHIVAMEIMANCHFKSSLLFIEKLFMDHSWKMWDTGKANHVNFRNLRKLVNRDDSYSMKSNRDFDHTMRVLEKFGMFNQENINAILESHLDHLKSLVSIHSDFFTIKDITLNEKCLNKINFNYIYALQDDYIPKEIENEEIENEELTLD